MTLWKGGFTVSLAIDPTLPRAWRRRFRLLPWRWVLPFGQLFLALFLLRLGTIQEEGYLDHFRSQRGVRVGDSIQLVMPSWDYMAPARELLCIIDFPALVILAPTREHVVILNSIISEVAFLFSVVLFWYWIGRKIDFQMATIGNRARSTRVSGSLATNLTGISAAAILCFYSVLGLVGTHYHRIFFAGIIWSGIFAAYYGYRLWALRGHQAGSH